jgi:hypothetical protein
MEKRLTRWLVPTRLSYWRRWRRLPHKEGPAKRRIDCRIYTAQGERDTRPLIVLLSNFLFLTYPNIRASTFRQGPS